jgi:hypothetical protein
MKIKLVIGSISTSLKNKESKSQLYTIFVSLTIKSKNLSLLSTISSTNPLFLNKIPTIIQNK